VAEAEEKKELNTEEKAPPKTTGLKKKLSGRQKAAMLLVSIGPDQAAEVFKYLKDDEIEQVSMEIANIKKLGHDNQEGVLEEFYQLCLAREYMAEGGMDYAQDILERAFGPSRAEELVKRMNNTLKRMGRPFDFIKNIDANQLVNFIKDEHPQTIAVILYNIKPSQASTVLMALPDDKQAEVAKRRCLDINPELKITAITANISREIIEEVFTGNYDFIIDAIDDVNAKVELIKFAYKRNIPIITSMGMGNKTDISKITLSLVEKTTVCPLARVMRKRLKDEGIKKVMCVYSTEEPKVRLPKPSSVVFVPAAAGLMMAQYVIMSIAQNK